VGWEAETASDQLAAPNAHGMKLLGPWASNVRIAELTLVIRMSIISSVPNGM
jgi:hypothetical protein